MSIRAMAWAFEQDKLNSIQKLVLLTIANYANTLEGSSPETCFPSQSLIAEKASLSRPCVNKIIGELEELGYLNVIARYRPNGSFTSCGYELNLPVELVKAFKERVDTSPVGFLYVAKSETKIKIGITRDHHSRIKALSTASGETVEAIKVYQMPMRVARKIEREALEQLKKYCLRGEWFNCHENHAISVLEGLLGGAVFQEDTNKSAVFQEDNGLSTGKTRAVFREDNHNQDSNRKKEPKNLLCDWPSSYREVFWNAYPRHVEKKAALARLDALKKSGEVSWNELMAGVIRYAAAVSKTEMKYVKHPTTWLNRGCWSDEARAIAAKPAEKKLSFFDIALGRIDDDERANSH